MNHTNAHLRNDRKIKFRMVSAQHFINETPGVLMGRVSVTISYSSRCLTTETVKYINENSFIENLAASKYSMWHRGKQM